MKATKPRTRYFCFTNNPQYKHGIITIAICPEVNPKTGKEVSRVGFAFTDPSASFYREASKKEAKDRMLSNASICVVGRPSSGKLADAARLAWLNVGKDFPDNPNWTKKIDLAMKAVVV